MRFSISGLLAVPGHEHQAAVVMSRISIIIPALNEAETLGETLEALQRWRRAGHEILLVDGGSRDATRELARPLVDLLLESPPGRAGQMNLGAARASGKVLLFLHADTRLPPAGDTMIHKALAQGNRWGRFDVRLSGRHWLLRVVERLMNWRSCLSGIATGDQGIFVERALFEANGGYPALPLMEDIALSQRLKRMGGRPACIRTPLVTSSRRWEQHGIVRTIVLMWRLRLMWFLGVPAERLSALYRYEKKGTPPAH